jgi:hypothetical protein
MGEYVEHRCGSTFLLGMALLLPVLNAYADAPVSICGESQPPFIYESQADDQGNVSISGFHLENFRLLTEVLALQVEDGRLVATACQRQAKCTASLPLR